MSRNWYILHTVSGFEKKVSKAIHEQSRKLGLEGAIEEVVVPTEAVVELRRGQKVNSEKKFLPGYILVKMDMNDQTWHMVRNIPKVSKFLGSDGKPSPITEAEAQRIFKQIEEGSAVTKTTLTYESGESIKVIDGPFESFVGVVMDVDDEKSRLKVSVSIFGRPTPVELEFTQVEKL